MKRKSINICFCLIICFFSFGFAIAQDETWKDECQDMSSPSCAFSYKETYFPKILMSFIWDENDFISNICTDIQGNIYLFHNNQNPRVEIYNNSGKIIGGFKYPYQTFGNCQISVDEEQNVLIYQPNGLGRVFDINGKIVSEFELHKKSIEKIGKKSRFRVWMSHGKVFSLTGGDFLNASKSSNELSNEDLKNSPINYSLHFPPGGSYELQEKGGSVEAENTITRKKINFPGVLNHGVFGHIELLDNVGNFYVLFDVAGEKGTLENGKPNYFYFPRLYKFNPDGDLLAGFNFFPSYIDPITQNCYFILREQNRKIIEIILWYRKK